MHRRYVHSESRTIAYFDSAPTNHAARALILIHGFPLAAAMWEAQSTALPTGWRLIAPDLRGFGGSTLADGDDPPSIDDYARDVIDLMHLLTIGSAVVGGLSMGGYVTLALLRLAPALARGAILANTRTTADTIEGRANRRAMLALIDREGPSGVARDMIPKLVGKTSREMQPDLEPFVRRLIKQQSADAIRGAVRRMMDRPDSTTTLERLTVPTLIIAGEEDDLTPVADAERMHVANPDTELVVIAGSGHLSNLEHPQVFNGAMHNFLSRL